jgi:hypothetical protein
VPAAATAAAAVTVAVVAALVPAVVALIDEPLLELSFFVEVLQVELFLLDGFFCFEVLIRGLACVTVKYETSVGLCKDVQCEVFSEIEQRT